VFGRDLVKPDFSRKPVYDNLYGKDGRWQTFNCSRCKSPVPIDLENYVGKAQDPEVVLDEIDGEAVKQHFGLLTKSLANGWPKFKTERCANCNAEFLVYVAEFEPANGWRQGVLQGITELAVK